MGKKPKSSRKGKKAWRANISTEDIEEFFDKSTKDALSGGSLTAVPSDSLFFVDKSLDLSVKRKIEKHREKVLWCDSVLQHNQFVEPIPSSTMRESKKKRKAVPRTEEAAEKKLKDEMVPNPGMVDLWNNKAEEGQSKKVKTHKPSIIPAVEVEPSGCSFNPSFESHQDSLAVAVAEELQKVYQAELGPQPVPETVPGEHIDEEDVYFLDVDDENDDTNLQSLDENVDKSSRKTKKVTRVELNKRARRKERQKSEAEAKRLKEFSKEIDSFPNIIEEIANEDQEKERRRIRRAVIKEERLKCCPPRLGKHKFEPVPTQVLLTEEISGSLRKLKGCCTLARDRFKSFEKRGLLVPMGKNRRRVTLYLLLVLIGPVI